MKQANLRFYSGISLIELIVFILVLSIVSVALFNALSYALIQAARGAANLTAAGLAQKRMEIIIGQRRMFGYSSNPATYDICASSPPAVCGATPSGYNIAVNMTNNTNMQLITVAVSGRAEYNLTVEFGNASF